MSEKHDVRPEMEGLGPAFGRRLTSFHIESNVVTRALSDRRRRSGDHEGLQISLIG